MKTNLRKILFLFLLLPCIAVAQIWPQQNISTEIMAADGVSFREAAIGALASPNIITSPLDGASGVSVTPTIATDIPSPKKWLQAVRDTTNQSNLAAGQDMKFNAYSGTLPYDPATGIVTLTANKHYLIRVSMGASMIAGYAIGYAIVRSSDNVELSKRGELLSANSNVFNSTTPFIELYYKPTVDTGIKVRIVQSTAGAGEAIRADMYSGISVDEIGGHHLTYTWSATQIQVRNKATGVVVYDSGRITALSGVVSPSLDAATQYEVRARHEQTDYTTSWLRWSDWRTFTTQ
jgi:hypothetical protein